MKMRLVLIWHQSKTPDSLNEYISLSDPGVCKEEFHFKTYFILNLMSWIICWFIHNWIKNLSELNSSIITTFNKVSVFLPGFGFGDNTFQMSFGIGAFPFGFFTSTLNFGDPRANASPRGTPQHMEEQFLSKIFLWLAILFLTWLLMA